MPQMKLPSVKEKPLPQPRPFKAGDKVIREDTPIMSIQAAPGVNLDESRKDAEFFWGRNPQQLNEAADMTAGTGNPTIEELLMMLGIEEPNAGMGQSIVPPEGAPFSPGGATFNPNANPMMPGVGPTARKKPKDAR